MRSARLKPGRSGALQFMWKRQIIPMQLHQYMSWKKECSLIYGQIWSSALTSWSMSNGSEDMDVLDPEQLEADYVRIRNEYHITQRVLAAVVELYLRDHSGDMLELNDEIVLKAPNLVAMRDEQRHIIALQVNRD